MRAKYFRFLSQTNSALKITLAICVSNLVKIGEENVPTSVDERENFVTPEVGRRACALHTSSDFIVCPIPRVGPATICIGLTTLCAGCPTVVTITASAGPPYEEGDELTCTSDGYDPTYKWIDTTTGGDVSTLNPFPLPTGRFTLTCVATVDELGCSAEKSKSGEVGGGIKTRVAVDMDIHGYIHVWI